MATLSPLSSNHSTVTLKSISSDFWAWQKGPEFIQKRSEDMKSHSDLPGSAHQLEGDAPAAWQGLHNPPLRAPESDFESFIRFLLDGDTHFQEPACPVAHKLWKFEILCWKPWAEVEVKADNSQVLGRMRLPSLEAIVSTGFVSPRNWGDKRVTWCILQGA